MAQIAVAVSVAALSSKDGPALPMDSDTTKFLPDTLTSNNNNNPFRAILSSSRSALQNTISDTAHPFSLTTDVQPVSSTQSKPPESHSALRDPHVLPTFSRSQSPILSLPPLLSSLPVGVVYANDPTTSPTNPSPSKPIPLSTDSRLPAIDKASLSLHCALHNFRPNTEEYAAAPYWEAFNWDELKLPEDEEREWYCVAFRSIRAEGSDSRPLYEADKKAHEEAVQNGGLILYWYGTPHPETGLNLATCIWQSRAHAMAANSRPHHVRAMRLAAASYERYDFERYRLQKVKGEYHVRVKTYDGGDVGW